MAENPTLPVLAVEPDVTAELLFADAVLWQVTAHLDPDENFDMDLVLELSDEVKAFISHSRDRWMTPVTAEQVAQQFVATLHDAVGNVMPQTARAHQITESFITAIQTGQSSQPDHEL